MKSAAGQGIVSVIERRYADVAWRAGSIFAFGVGAAAARRFLDFHLGVPGHSGVGWIAAMVLGYLVTRQRGAGLAIGLTAAAMSGPLGLGHSAAYNVLFFGLAGLLLDLAFALPAIAGRAILGAAVAGGVAHMGKFAIVAAGATAGVSFKHVAVVGLMGPAASHLLFGLLGGLLGGALFLGGKAAISHLARR